MKIKNYSNGNRNLKVIKMTYQKKVDENDKINKHETLKRYKK